MSRIYYDTIENLKNDFEKKLLKDVQIDNNKKEIRINNEKIKYKEIDIPFRSFSRPFFVENQIKIYDDNSSEELQQILDTICIAYTDREIEAIINAMPILKDYSSKRIEELKDVAVIWRDHFLEDNIGLLTSFIRMGVKPEDMLVIDKGDSTKHRNEITYTFKKLGFQVEILDNSAIEEEYLLLEGKKIIDEFITKRLDKQIVILDDGAIVSEILIDTNYQNVKSIVELTEMGLRRIRKLKMEELPYPVLNIAKTSLKKYITYKEISNTIFTRTIELLGAEKLSGRTLIQLGYGDLGETLAERYRQYGVRVIIVDPDIMKLIQATEKGFVTYKTLEEAIQYETPFIVVGASGEQSISRKVVEQLEDGSYVTAGATADLSIFKEYEKENVRHKFIPKYGTQYEINGKRITVLGNGRSVNLFDSESIPNKAIDIFKAGTLVTAHMSIKDNDKLVNKLQLDIVEEWINKSNILELYYDLYLSKK